MTIQSQAGRGTTVQLVLPLTGPEAEPDNHQGNAALPMQGNWFCWLKTNCMCAASCASN